MGARIPPATSTRRGGSAARRTARGQEARAARLAAPPYIQRNVGVFELLDEEGLALIERNADLILAEIGMEFRGDAEVLAILREAGARVEGERVRFEPGHCRATIEASAPREFVQHARNPERSVRIGGNNSLFCPSFGPPFVHDMDAGRRYATLADFENLTRLHYLLASVHHSGGVVCEPVDLPVTERHLSMIRAHLILNDKPFMGAVTAPERAEDTVKMARIVFGDRFVDSHCCIYSVVNSNAPLVLDATMLGALKVYARAGQAVVVSPFILAGAMSPVTVAGTLAQLLAEALAGLALIQLIRPGAPCVFGTFSSPISLKTGAPTFGTPEGMQIQMCAAALARRLGVPFHSVGALTASKVPDAQAAYESATQLLGAFMAGVHFIIHATGCLEGLLTMGYEKTLMDADRCAALQKFAAGVDLSPEAQALDAIREVGPGHHFLGSAHTLRHFETANFLSDTADNSTFEQWTADGSRWQHQRLNARFKEMLEQYEPPPMDQAVREGIDDFVTRRLEAIRKPG
ncbi:MAG: trimethylamine methyltransferase family protein [bacterium]|nr:trimethylamine methyltransferase family protein [bacterium]MDE0417789.1 trimethylamine methyltransferase family protein [bacterium]